MSSSQPRGLGPQSHPECIMRNLFSFDLPFAPTPPLNACILCAALEVGQATSEGGHFELVVHILQPVLGRHAVPFGWPPGSSLSIRRLALDPELVAPLLISLCSFYSSLVSRFLCCPSDCAIVAPADLGQPIPHTHIT
jgi:hypothetical protein